MWLVMNIGCLECGVSSKIVGVFTDKAEAERVAAACDRVFYERQEGQNRFKVFVLPAPDLIDAEYMGAFEERRG